MQDKIVEGLLALSHEVAAIDGAGDTGMGAGQYEVFVTRNGVEYRVTVEPYWDEDADSPIDA